MGIELSFEGISESNCGETSGGFGEFAAKSADIEILRRNLVGFG